MKLIKDNADLKKHLKLSVKIVSILLCVYFFLNIMFIDTYSIATYFFQKNRLERMKTSNDRIIDHNKQLEIEIEKLRHDSSYIESLARRNYTMVKPGETVFIFKQD